MRLIRFVPDRTSFDFVRYRVHAFAVSLALLLVTLGSLLVVGLNLGIDFSGGLLLEVRSTTDFDVAATRAQLQALEVGEVQLQTFGDPRDLLIRVQLPEDQGEAAQQALAELVRRTVGEQLDWRRVEYVGPSVGSELLFDGVVATLLAVAAIAAYVAFRFEWQFGIAALIATFHDVAITVGLYSVAGLEFNMTSVAALLTLAGYSINDTVVVFDRIRENLRRHKRASLAEIINLSVNETLSRTVLTGGSTLLGILALILFGGPTLLGFSFSLGFGIILGTLSSVFVAAALLLYMPPVRKTAPAGEAVAPPADKAAKAALTRPTATVKE
jgi:preprotein translocase SecF subunit